MNTDSPPRYCSCGTILNSYNSFGQCNACREKNPQGEHIKVHPGKPSSNRGTCSNCKREGLVLVSKKTKLCGFCRTRAQGHVGKKREEALAQAAREMKGKGKQIGNGWRWHK